MTQADLAQMLGISYQQVQKYECGANRIGAGRLWKTAELLAVPVSFFFEGIPEAEQGQEPEADRKAREFAASPMGAQALYALSQIDDSAMQRSILTLLEQIVDGSDTRIAR